MARPPLPASPTAKQTLEAWIETVYRECFGHIPVDRFLTYWRQAGEFCSLVRDGYPNAPEDHLILQMLMNLRKKGHLNSGRKAKG